MVNIQHNVPLEEFNTFGIAVRAKAYVDVRNEEDLSELISKNLLPDLDRMILGGGSNVLFTQDFDGLLIHLGIAGKKVVEESEHEVVLEVGAGENWHGLVLHCIAQDWGGIENLSLIPGKVGAAPLQNIGAYGVELKDVFEYLDFMYLDSGEVRRFCAEDCQFGYRDSIFKRELKGKVVVLRVALRLRKQNHQINTSYGAIGKELEARGISEPSIRDISEVVIAIRQSKLPDPAVIGNGGSFFKNPELPLSEFERLRVDYPDLPGYVVSETVMKVPAAWLIDRAGWKGKRFGNYGVHDRQALVLVNHGGAQGQDIYDLSEEILQSVLKKYGVRLEREVNVI